MRRCFLMMVLCLAGLLACGGGQNKGSQGAPGASGEKVFTSGKAGVSAIFPCEPSETEDVPGLISIECGSGSMYYKIVATNQHRPDGKTPSFDLAAADFEASFSDAKMSSKVDSVTNGRSVRRYEGERAGKKFWALVTSSASGGIVAVSTVKPGSNPEPKGYAAAAAAFLDSIETGK
jgi:hypothetical protein